MAEPSQEPQVAPDVPGPPPPPSDHSTDLAAAQARITEPDARKRRRRPLLIGCFLIVALLIAAPLVLTAILGGPSFQSIGFGTGGSGCDLTNVASTFPRGVPIRDVLMFSPELAAGGTVTIKVELNGTELVDLRDTVKVDEPSGCIYGTWPALEPGHYRVEYKVSPSKMPPISGEFEVVPPTASASPTVVATSGPTGYDTNQNGGPAQ